MLLGASKKQLEYTGWSQHGTWNVGLCSASLRSVIIPESRLSVNYSNVTYWSSRLPNVIHIIFVETPFLLEGFSFLSSFADLENILSPGTLVVTEARVLCNTPYFKKKRKDPLNRFSKSLHWLGIYFIIYVNSLPVMWPKSFSPKCHVAPLVHTALGDLWTSDWQLLWHSRTHSLGMKGEVE